MDILTVVGLLLAFCGIIGGQILEGGHPGALVQGTAFMIVVIGSLGATIVATPMQDLIGALKGLKSAFVPPKTDFKGMLAKLLELANLARREGLLALEAYTSDEDSDPFLVKCLTLAIDGSPAEVIREAIDVDMEIAEEDLRAASKFWENWGALSPTIGVLGAVLGLIHVMENLDNPAAIGPGIAVAFVATVYGVGFANVIALPIAFKLRRRIHHMQLLKSMTLEGVVGIQSGIAPGALRSRLRLYLGSHGGHAAEQR